MLKQAAGFLAGKGSDTEKMQQLLEGITGIYVKSFEFNAPNVYAESDVETVRKQLSGSGWSRVVRVREKGELTEIYFWRERRHDWRPRHDFRRAQRVDSGQHRRSRRSRISRSVGADDPENAGRNPARGHRNSYFTVISNNRGHSFPVTKIRFFWASKAIPLSTASALSFAIGPPSSPLRLIQPSTRPSFGEMRTM